MVVLTVVIPQNGHTVYFDEPIPKTDYIRLISCSLFNSWHNLKETGEILLKINLKKKYKLNPRPLQPRKSGKNN